MWNPTWASVTVGAASDVKTDMVSVYENQFGFLSSTDYSFLLSKEDSILASYSGDLRGYYLTEMMLSNAYAFYGNNRMAFVIIDDLYNKADATHDDFGKGIALFATARIYHYLRRSEDACNSFHESLGFLERTKNDVIIDIVRFHAFYSSGTDTPYYAQFKDYVDNIKDATDSGFEKMSIYKSVAYRLILIKSLINDKNNAEAKEYVGGLLALLDGSLQGALAKNVEMAVAGYHEFVGDYQAALAMYETVISKYHKKHLPLNSDYFYCFRKIADLHFLLGDEEKAVDEYDTIFFSYKRLREEHYSFEMDKIVARMRADVKRMDNERSKAKSIRLNIFESLLVIVIFILLIYTSIRNIRNWRKSKYAMEQAKSYAEESIKRKAAYLSNMSHEIRTPLNSIIGFSSLLTSDDDELDEDLKAHALEVINSNTKMMLQLINDIPGDESRKTQRKHTYVTVDACALCRTVIETIVKSYNPELRITFESGFEGFMMDTDEISFSQILINLLVNAIKFTKEGSITVSLEKKDEETALFSVTDTGCGIPLLKQKKIFERFEKSNESDEGTGLGLSICSLLIKELGGEIWVDPEYASGTRFYFTHPIKKAV